MAEQLRGSFEKFVDSIEKEAITSPYYSESELCGGAVTVSSSLNKTTEMIL
jgi:hypothetical protein